MKIIWTVPAKTYLKEIYLYYYEVAGKKVASKIQKNIFVAAKKLANMAELGLIEPELEHTKFEYRSLIAGNYKIIYRIADGYIHIVDVLILGKIQKSWGEVSKGYHLLITLCHIHY